MVRAADAEGLVQLGVERPEFFFVVGVASTVAGLPGECAVFEGLLAGLAVLVGELAMNLVNQQGVELLGMGEGVAFTVDAVFSILGADGCGIAVVAQYAGVGVVLVTLVGQLQAAAVAVIPAEFAQQVVGAVIQRVGLLARCADTTLTAVGVRGLTAAPAQMQQTIDLTQACGEGGAALPAVIAAVITGFQAGVSVIAFVQIVAGILGQEAHRAANRIAAVQRTGRATDDFHLLDGVEVDVIALGAEETAKGESVRHTDAIDLGQYAVAANAADGKARQAEAITTATDRYAGLVADQILDVLDVLLVDLPFGLYRHGARHLVEGLLGTGGRDGHGIELVRRFLGAKGQRWAE